MRHSARRLSARLLCSSSSRADGLRGSRVLSGPRQRDAEQRSASAAVGVADAYARHKEAPTDASARILKATQERAARLRSDLEAGNSSYAHTTGGMITDRYGLNAAFAQMERSGEFKNLPGAGKPLAERHSTHFNDDAGLDHIMKRILGENKFAPPSVELHNEFLAKRKEMRQALAAAVAAKGSLSARQRASVEHELEELRALRTRFDDASIKDSFSFNLPIKKLPPVNGLEEELAIAASAGAPPGGPGPGESG